MSQIRSKNTKPELVLRKELFRLGFRYKLHDNKLPGKPDIVLPKYKTTIFVHGCFWHSHKNCRDGHLPKSKLDYWEPKLKKNIERDIKSQTLLRKAGWKVVTIWECDLKKQFNRAILKIMATLKP